MMAAIMTGDISPRHDLAHQVQHLVVKDFAVLDGALQRLLRGDLAGVGHGRRPQRGGADRCSASLIPKPTNKAPATRSSQCMPCCTTRHGVASPGGQPRRSRG